MTDAQPTLLSPRVLFPFALVTMIWGSTWIVITGQLGVVPPSCSVTYRFTVAAAAMFVFAVRRREKLVPDARALGFAAMPGIAKFTFNFNFVYRAVQHITTGPATVLFPLLTVPKPLFGRAFLKTPLDRGFLAR